MLNPVLILDLQLASRRGRTMLVRYLYALWLFMQVAWVLAHLFDVPGSPANFAASLEWFIWFNVVQHFLLLLVAVPAQLAGAITDEKAKGTLQLLLTTHLTPAQIVIGKFAS